LKVTKKQLQNRVDTLETYLKECERLARKGIKQFGKSIEACISIEFFAKKALKVSNNKQQ
jgi:hypothetical protein